MKKLLFAISILIVSLACVGSALQLPTPTSTAAPSSTPTSTPVYTTYIVTSDVLEIRLGPTEISRNIGYLERGAVVTVYETKKTTLEKCSEWAKIGIRSWVCFDRLAEKE